MVFPWASERLIAWRTCTPNGKNDGMSAIREVCSHERERRSKCFKQIRNVDPCAEIAVVVAKPLNHLILWLHELEWNKFLSPYIRIKGETSINPFNWFFSFPLKLIAFDCFDVICSKETIISFSSVFFKF